MRAFTLPHTHHSHHFQKLAGARYPLLKRVSELKLLSLTAEVGNSTRMQKPTLCVLYQLMDSDLPFIIYPQYNINNPRPAC